MRARHTSDEQTRSLRNFAEAMAEKRVVVFRMGEMP